MSDFRNSIFVGEKRKKRIENFVWDCLGSANLRVGLALVYISCLK